jgi:enoyl-CoA hydratase/carnithine racemase
VSDPGGVGLARSSDGARADVALAIRPVNVLRAADLVRLAGCVREAAPPARVVVLRGLPHAFSAGVDVAEHAPEPAAIETMLGAMRSALSALVEAPAVTVAAVSGACLGGGAEIAAACDVVIVAEDARVAFPEIGLACFPPGACALLPLRVGEARAAEWILTGRRVSGREAAEAGFAARAVPAARLEAETESLVARLLATAPAALAAARDLLRAPRREALAGRLPAAEEAYRRLTGDADLAKAVAGFERGRSR